jgi:hypothetical protein
MWLLGSSRASASLERRDGTCRFAQAAVRGLPARASAGRTSSSTKFGLPFGSVRARDAVSQLHHDHDGAGALDIPDLGAIASRTCRALGLAVQRPRTCWSRGSVHPGGVSDSGRLSTAAATSLPKSRSIVPVESLGRSGTQWEMARRTGSAGLTTAIGVSSCSTTSAPARTRARREPKKLLAASTSDRWIIVLAHSLSVVSV